jgi:hypothetical protein
MMLRIATVLCAAANVRQSMQFFHLASFKLLGGRSNPAIENDPRQELQLRNLPSAPRRDAQVAPCLE